MSKRGSVQSLITIALLAAVICVVAPLALYIGTVPVSMATFIIYIAICVFGAGKCCLAVLVYIFVGAVGIPVFSGYTAGVGQLAGPTGGYILGYLAMSASSGVIIKVLGAEGGVYEKLWVIKRIVALMVGTVVLYVTGTAWYVFVTDNTWLQALSVCVIPFVVFDIIKIVTAVMAGRVVKRNLKKARLL